MKPNFVLVLLVLLTHFVCASDFQNMRVVWIEKPQFEATIIWDSDQPSEGDYIMIKKKGGEPLKLSANFEQAYTNVDKKRKPIDEPSFYVRHIKCSHLESSTTYYFTAYSKGEKSREYHFTTANYDDRDYKLVFVGDSRTRVEVAEKISGQINELFNNDPKVLAVLHGGDYANSPELKHWKPWLKAYSLTTNKDGRLLPIIPVCGNHEMIKRSQLYGEAYGFPGNREKYYYSCELSPNVHIAILNTNLPALGEQQQFLKKTLSDYKMKKVAWQFAAYHRPIYPAIKSPYAGLTAWVPLFDEFSLDIALESDGHCIKRTIPIKDNKPNSKGTVYLGEGGYGAPQRTPKEKWYLEGPGMASSGDHFMLLHLQKDLIEYQTVSIDDKVLDQYAFKPRSR